MESVGSRLPGLRSERLTFWLLCDIASQDLQVAGDLLLLPPNTDGLPDEVADALVPPKILAVENIRPRGHTFTARRYPY